MRRRCCSIGISPTVGAILVSIVSTVSVPGCGSDAGTASSTGSDNGATGSPRTLEKGKGIVNPVRVGTREERFGSVRNYSSTKWSDLSVNSPAAWVSVQVRPSSSPLALQAKDAPLQVWDTVIHIEGDKLSEGWNVAAIRFRPTGHDQLQEDVSVRAYRAPSVPLTPDFLFSCARIVNLGNVGFIRLNSAQAEERDTGNGA